MMGTQNILYINGLTTKKLSAKEIIDLFWFKCAELVYAYFKL
jgi:hypothetical protein